MLRLSISLLALACTLSGCGGVGSTFGSYVVSVPAKDGSELRLYQYACSIKTVDFINQSSSPTHQEAFKFVATNSAGVTQRQWTAYCDATAPKATSRCMVHEDLGTGFKTWFPCSEYRQFALSQ